jgi:tight adherence protein B
MTTRPRTTGGLRSTARRAAAISALTIVSSALAAFAGSTSVVAQTSSPAAGPASTAVPTPASVATPAASPATTGGTVAGQTAPLARTERTAPDVFIVIDNNVRLDDRLAGAKSAVRTYVNGLPVGSRVGLVTFGESPQMIRDLSLPGAGLAEAIAGIVPEGDPAVTGQLYGAVAMAAENLARSTSRNPAVLLVSDGRDDGISASFADATSALANVSARVDVIDLGADGSGVAVLNQFTVAGGTVVKATDLLRIQQLAAGLGAPAELALTEPDRPGLMARIFSSPLVLAIGGLAVFAGLAVGGLAVFGPKEPQVDLLGTGRYTNSKKKAKKQTTIVTGLAERLSDVADKQLAKSGKDRGLNAKLEQAALNLRSGEFLVLAACVGLAVAAVANLLIGRIGAVIGVILGAVGALQWVSFRAKKRSKRFGEQLPDTLQLLASSLRAGQGLVQAVDSVAREAEAPTKEEFHRIVVETRLGRDLVEAMRATAVRIKSEDMEWVVPAVEINREVGGDLAEVLDQVGQTIRDRSDLRRQVKTLSAEGRLSAIILLALPFTLAGFIKMANPEYMDPLFKGAGLYMIGLAGLAMVIGGFWLMKICKIEF